MFSTTHEEWAADPAGESHLRAFTVALTPEQEAAYRDAGLSTLVAVYRQRIGQLSDGPVRKDWDGVFEATRK